MKAWSHSSHTIRTKQIWLMALGFTLIAVSTPSSASAQIFRGWGFSSPSSWTAPYPYDGGCASGTCPTQRPWSPQTRPWAPAAGYRAPMWFPTPQSNETARPVYQVQPVAPTTSTQPAARPTGDVENPYYTYRDAPATIRTPPIQPPRRSERPAVNQESPFYP